jgi:hypothetical protein
MVKRPPFNMESREEIFLAKAFTSPAAAVLFARKPFEGDSWNLIPPSFSTEAKSSALPAHLSTMNRATKSKHPIPICLIRAGNRQHSVSPSQARSFVQNVRDQRST